MITLEQVIATVKEIVAEQPEKKADCFYSVEQKEKLGYEHTTPECIVGQYVYRALGEEVFKRLGTSGQSLVSQTFLDELTPERFKFWDTKDNQLLRELGLEAKAIDFLAAIQADQDLGLTWRESFDNAVARRS